MYRTLVTAGSEALGPVRGQLLFPAVTVVVVLIGPGILPCCGWVPGFVQEYCLCGLVVEIAVACCQSLPLDYCQWMVQQQLMGGERGGSCGSPRSSAACHLSNLKADSEQLQGVSDTSSMMSSMVRGCNRTW